MSTGISTHPETLSTRRRNTRTPHWVLPTCDGSEVCPGEPLSYPGDSRSSVIRFVPGGTVRIRIVVASVWGRCVAGVWIHSRGLAGFWAVRKESIDGNVLSLKLENKVHVFLSRKKEDTDPQHVFKGAITVWRGYQWVGKAYTTCHLLNICAKSNLVELVAGLLRFWE